MAETDKRIEVRYGAFACRVEGFDDPMERLREVLSLVQQAIAETPALADRASALDAAQLARLHDALGSRGADGDPDIPGVVVIRDGQRPAADIADAETLEVDAAADAGSQPAIDAPPAEAGPHPSAAIHAAPAAAVAKAAFSAGVASEDAAPPGGASRQGPLGADRPDQAATPAALYAAPAALVAGTAFSRGFADAAPADDDVEEPGPERTDETADDRPAGFATARGRHGEGADEDAASWSSGPAAASSMMEAFRQSGFDGNDDQPRRDAGGTGDASEGRVPGPAPDDAGAEPLPAINIFAPPPDDPGFQVPETGTLTAPQPGAALHRGPRPATAEAGAEGASATPPAGPLVAGRRRDCLQRGLLRRWRP